MRQSNWDKQWIGFNSWKPHLLHIHSTILPLIVMCISFLEILHLFEYRIYLSFCVPHCIPHAEISMIPRASAKAEVAASQMFEHNVGIPFIRNYT